MFTDYIGRLDHSVPRSKRLLSDDRSNILVYMTGELSVVVLTLLPIELCIQ